MVMLTLVHNRSGEAWIESAGVWRASTWIEGAVRTELRDPALAKRVGGLAGRFHRAVADLEHAFAFTRAGIHDTARRLRELEAALAAERGDLVREIGEAILEHARGLDPLPATRRRIVHGDLKISNVIWSADGEAIALCDLDTLAHGIFAHEMGDALRSWCNPAGESAAGAVDVPLFAAAVEGWAAEVRGLAEDDEISSVAAGTETIALELASRFATDVVDDRYFGWDPSRFPTRAAHNLARARSQLALARSIRASRAALERAVASAFR
jgi:Ser/Thr protein kinase RdoA (MazF antagonist)